MLIGKMLCHILNIFISWIRIWLNSTKTHLLWAISRSPLSWNWDVLTGREIILWWWKHIFHRRCSNISHHTNIHLNNLYNYYFVCVVQGGPSIGQPPLYTGTYFFLNDSFVWTNQLNEWFSDKTSKLPRPNESLKVRSHQTRMKRTKAIRTFLDAWPFWVYSLHSRVKFTTQQTRICLMGGASARQLQSCCKMYSCFCKSTK